MQPETPIRVATADDHPIFRLGVRLLLASEPDLQPASSRRFAPGGTAPAAASLIAEAIGGAWDIDYRWSGCERHTAMVRLLVARDPDRRVVGTLSSTSLARATSTLENRIARLYAHSKGCHDLLSIVGR